MDNTNNTKPSNFVSINQSAPSDSNSTPSPANRTTVSPEDYKRSPYGSIITIARLAQQLEKNASLELMEAWTGTDNNQHYLLLFQVHYPQPFPNGTNLKAYNVTASASLTGMGNVITQKTV
jgi:hypothetical protein